MVKESFQMSLSNIANNRMRSFLTILGILIGVTAVIALITTINGFSASLSDSFNSMGAGTMTLNISGNDVKSGLTKEDIDALVEMDEIKGVTPSTALSSRVSRDGNYETGVSVSGKNAFYFENNPDSVLRGRGIDQLDVDNMAFVCLVSKDIMESLFYGTDPIGQNLYIDGRAFGVIGLFEDSESSSMARFGSSGTGVMMPYTTALKLSNRAVVAGLTIYLNEGVDSASALEKIEAKLDSMFNYEEDCYSIFTMSSLEDTMASMLSMVSMLLAGIASIALLVGGIGIMNMMLTTVSERKVEIGLKKAVGALPGQIQTQFLIESFVLAMIGGIAGIVLGLALSMLLCTVMGTAFRISYGAILLGAGFSAAVGIVFGWTPARKASMLNPIDALRAM
jgi:ABC-type antimicrobial peptide transport system, permease component